jgi:hypothetical protein
MPVKILKTAAKTKGENNHQDFRNSIPELTSQQAYNLVNALEDVHCWHVSQVYITGEGYFFSPGNELHEYVDLDPKIPGEAALMKQGKRQKKILLPGKYIARKPVIKEYAREEILENKDEIISVYKAEQRALKASQKDMEEHEDNPVKAITEALQKLTESKRS